MTIVCATHFTDSSFAAVRTASGLARKHRQPLWLVSVLPRPFAGEAAQEGVTDALLLEAAALAGKDLDVSTATLRGPLDRAVGQFCAQKRAQLLVVGDSSRQTSSMFASTLDTFAFGVDLPLLVVRDSRPFEKWILGTPLKVMLAFDHAWSSEVARDWVCRLAEYGPIELVATHIWWPADEYERRALVPSADGHTAISILMHGETEAALRGLPANVTHRVHLEMGRDHAAQQLVALAAEEQVEVLVLGTNPHRGPISMLRSAAHEVLSSAPMSVACVPGRLVLTGLSPARPAATAAASAGAR